MFIGNATWWCQGCDTTARGPCYQFPRCPLCRAGMVRMGTKWCPGRKESRKRAWDDRRARRAAQRKNRTDSPQWSYLQRPSF